MHFIHAVNTHDMVPIIIVIVIILIRRRNDIASIYMGKKKYVNN